MRVRIQITCPYCGYAEDYTRLLGACPNCGGGYLNADYEVEGRLPWPDDLAGRPHSMWRFRELLPIRDPAHIVSMGEGDTPLLRFDNLGAMLGLRHLYVKDERQGPTGSFKDRQASLAISALRELGIDEMVVASTGNVAIAYSAYAARAGIKLWCFTISSVPAEKMREVTLYGTELVKVTGTYDQAKQVAERFAQYRNIFLDRGVKGIAAKESMKTIAFEIAEALGAIYGPSPNGAPWRTPHWYIQSVSGGLGPIGVMKGFRELERFGLSAGLPKLGNIQASGCAPMVQGWQAGLEDAPPVLQPKTRIATVATGVPGISYAILRSEVLACGGTFESVSDEDAYRALKTVAQLEGLSVEPATALAFAGLIKMVRQKMIDPDEVVVVNCSGHTFPVETHILGGELGRDVDVRPAAHEAVPTEGLLAALQAVDTRITQAIVIEDDPDASRLMARILKAHGVQEIRQAFDGQTGIEAVQHIRPDLIILDLMMPHIDGFGVLERLKADENLRDVPVVVVTAKDLTPDERARLTGQVRSLLHKGSFLDGSVLQDLLDEKLR
mgnify:CR=1 FL=1